MRTWIASPLLALAVALPACGADDSTDPSDSTTDVTRDPSNPDTAINDKPSDPGATETNLAPAVCTSDADCPTGVQCLYFHNDATGEDGPGFCDVQDTSSTTSSAVPALCEVDADCGSSGRCAHVHDENGEDSFSICHITDLNCPEGTVCI